MRGIHRWTVNSPHKWPVTQNMFPFDDVIMNFLDSKQCITITSSLPSYFTPSHLDRCCLIIHNTQCPFPYLEDIIESLRLWWYYFHMVLVSHYWDLIHVIWYSTLKTSPVLECGCNEFCIFPVQYITDMYIPYFARNSQHTILLFSYPFLKSHACNVFWYYYSHR